MDEKLNLSSFVETDTNLGDVARWLHDEICNCDDKTCTVETEIMDWLKDGDPFGCTMHELLSEALEHDFLS